MSGLKSGFQLQNPNLNLTVMGEFSHTFIILVSILASVLPRPLSQPVSIHGLRSHLSFF